VVYILQNEHHLLVVRLSLLCYFCCS